MALCLNTCLPILGAHVFTYPSEDQLLLAWQRLVLAYDPDLLTGYNIMNFDIPYLYDRAHALKCPMANKIGRIQKKSMVVCIITDYKYFYSLLLLFICCILSY